VKSLEMHLGILPTQIEDSVEMAAAHDQIEDKRRRAEHTGHKTQSISSRAQFCPLSS
jgi:hypothetical protein